MAMTHTAAPLRKADLFSASPMAATQNLASPGDLNNDG